MHKQCYAIGGRINFNYDCVSLCHGIDIGDQIVWRLDEGIDFTPELYKERVKELTEINQSECAKCKGCSNLIEGAPDPEIIDIVTINQNFFCQCRCVYCVNFKGERESLYNPLPMIKNFIAAGMISKNCLFDWGGGESTVSNDFEEIFTYLLESGYMQRVNTNAVYLSDLVYKNLDNDLVSLRISLDSGNAETYFSSKGRRLFNQVVDNIAAYRSKTENVLLKYVITNINSNEDSICDFVDLADRLKIRAVCIDVEMHSYGSERYDGLLCFTEKELSAAKLLQKKAHEKGLNVQIGYVWTAQNPDVPSRDFNHIKDIRELIEENEEYSIPDTLSDFNRNKISIYSKGIIPVVLSSFELILARMKDKKIIIYGAGNNGRMLLSVLQRYGIKVLCFCDKNKADQTVENVPVRGLRDVAENLDDNTVVILTPNCSKEIVIELNRENYVQFKDRLYYLEAIRYSDRVLDEMESN